MTNNNYFKKWKYIISHNNKKYGCPHIIKINNEHIHKTNDFNGLLQFYEHIECTCNACFFLINGCGDKGSVMYKCTEFESIYFN